MSTPVPPNEEERLADLRRLGVLDTPPEKAFDRLTELAAKVFKVPISTVTLIDEDRQWFKSCIGLNTREMGRDVAFCAYAILSDEVLVVPDARQDPRFAENPLVTGEPHIRFYAGAPLRTAGGLNLGTLCIIDTAPRAFGEEAVGMLAGLAAQSWSAKWSCVMKSASAGALRKTCACSKPRSSRAASPSSSRPPISTCPALRSCL